ncbi:NAD(P)-binding protein [Zopfia rhizophila CBS 207.26]|uniref:NAD(P)-binding protein n=1 Tax=Zopfia rhizophila CBS 207.26 TaxID=1314779 RepID=A0A6A6DX15_9PEZI|nr:NAD(P)-binding protein [Zopfia rhizophila CBS 207.26]
MVNREKNVLVFGPTGGVGRAAAIEAGRRGARVWLAVRDTKKTIRGLGKDTEENPGFVRVQADLSQPNSLKHAVEQSGATTTFVYTMHESEDHMRASFEALKEAGITYVVLLSSFGVQGSAREEANMSDFLSRVHAQTEIALEETGISYAAIRPAYFNSNIFWNTPGIQKGEVEVLYPNVKFDYIAPEDIGTVCGALLVEPRFREGGQISKTIYLCGPELMSQREAFDIVAQALGRSIKIKEIGEAAFFEKHKFLPEPVALSIVNGLRKTLPPNSGYPQELYEEAVANIRKYAEREPTRFIDWVKSHKDVFA